MKRIFQNNTEYVVYSLEGEFWFTNPNEWERFLSYVKENFNLEPRYNYLTLNQYQIQSIDWLNPLYVENYIMGIPVKFSSFNF